MRVFLDTNVIAGMLDGQRDDHAACRELLIAAEDRRIAPVLTGMTLVNALYAVRKAGFRRGALMEFARYILALSEVAAMDMSELHAAIDSDWPDFEDAVQYQAALHIGRIEAIITSDQDGFTGSRIKVYPPGSFIDQFLRS